jgi:hypothetical protein
MTDAAVPSTPAQDVGAGSGTIPSTGGRTLLWGAGLMALGLLCTILGSQPATDGSTDLQPVLVLGWIVGAIAAPILLIGIIAVGVRMGLDDHDGDR